MHFAHDRARPYTGMAISCVDLISVCCMHFLGCVISPQGSARGCHESRRLYCYPPPPQPLLLLLQWTITGSPAGHGRSSSHSWLRSWFRLPIGCQGAITHTVCFLCFLFFGFNGFLWCGIVSGNFVKMIESNVLKCKYMFHAQKVSENTECFLFQVEKY